MDRTIHEDRRSAYEMAMSEHPDLLCGIQFRRDVGGRYIDQSVYNGWRIWNCAANLYSVGATKGRPLVDQVRLKEPEPDPVVDLIKSIAARHAAQVTVNIARVEIYHDQGAVKDRENMSAADLGLGPMSQSEVKADHAEIRATDQELVDLARAVRDGIIDLIDHAPAGMGTATEFRERILTELAQYTPIQLATHGSRVQRAKEAGSHG